LLGRERAVLSRRDDPPFEGKGIDNPSADDLAGRYREVQKQLRQAVDEGKAKVHEEPLSESEVDQVREQIIADTALWHVEQRGGTADDYVEEIERIKREEVGQ
jgi:hypothetical protein